MRNWLRRWRDESGYIVLSGIGVVVLVIILLLLFGDGE